MMSVTDPKLFPLMIREKVEIPVVEEDIAVSSPFQIYTIDSASMNTLIDKCSLSNLQYRDLMGSQFSKAICPYKVMIVGTKDYPDSYLLYAANLVGNLLDPDHTG